MTFGTIAATSLRSERNRVVRRRRRLPHAALVLALTFGTTSLVAHAGVINVDWQAPTTNADGSPLIDLASYRVYAATSVPSCPSSAFEAYAAPGPTPAPGETVAATLTSLSTGTTYWVRVSAVDSGGNESECTTAVSGVARTEIDPTPSALNFSGVTIGTTKTLDFTVQNLGETTLTGVATATAPFNIVSGQTLNVAPGTSQAVRVSFTPPAEQVFGASVTFTTSDDQISRPVSGSGVMAAPAVLQFNQAAYTVTEGGAATITVTRTGGTQGGVTASYAIGNGTATAGTDYTAASGTLTFGPGVTTQTFTVGTARDKRAESGETVTLTLGNPQGGAVLGALNAAILTINDKAGRRGR